MSLRNTLAFLISIFGVSCSSAPQRAYESPFETASYVFLQAEAFSKDYDRHVPIPLVRDKKENRIIIDFSKEHSGSEWTHVLENSAGVVATMDQTIEGRGWEVPILVLRTAEKSWSEIPFKKPHFSAEILKIALDTSEIRIRLGIEPSTVKPSKLTGKIMDDAGRPIDYADWSYSFTRKAWRLSRTPLSF